MDNIQPLAHLLRPKSIEEVIGQNHLLNKNGIVSRVVETNTPINLIFYGYPGIGKTTLAFAICNDLKIPYDIFNASVDNKEKLTEIIKVAKQNNGRYILIIEEIHRLNKDKQDILLPYVENGTVIIFATTTENPYFTINPAIRSRCTIARLDPVSADELFLGLKRIIRKNKQLIKTKINDEILKIIAFKSNGDVRTALNVIDIIERLYKGKKITIDLLHNIMAEANVLSSSYGDEYYDVLSAFHKSIRGSDVDAAIYYLARLTITQDLISITRRMIACAYEDIGLANTPLCSRVVTACEACVKVGFPECHQILADTVIEMALSPKSNSGYLAFYKALDDIKNGKDYEIPKHLKDNNYASHAKLNGGQYIYPHDYDDHYYANQDYLPNQLKGKRYYNKTLEGSESKLNAHLEALKEKYKKN